MNKKIKIALFVPWIKSKGGVERTILRILENPLYECDVYTFFYNKKSTFEEFNKYNINVIGKLNSKGFIGKGLGLFLKLLSTKIKGLEEYDIFIVSTAGIAEFITIRNKHKKTVALCHTPLRVAHTMYDYYKKEGLKNKIILPVAIPIYKAFEKTSWKNIDSAVVLSKEVKNRIINYGLLPDKKIFDIGPHVDYSNIKKTHYKTEKIIFYPSRFIKYKRQDLAVKSFNLSGLAKLGFKLVIAGFAEDEKYFSKIKSMETNSIIIKKNLSEKELDDLYSRCYATIFLAINEDTGLTPLESLAYGKPVISVNEGGPKEFIKNGKNGLLVDANERSISNALIKITNSKFYAKLVNGAKNSKRYDEKEFMKNFDEAIETILTR